MGSQDLPQRLSRCCTDAGTVRCTDYVTLAAALAGPGHAAVDLLLSASGLNARVEERHFVYPAANMGADIAGVAAGPDGHDDNEFFTCVDGGAWSFDLIFGDRRQDDPTGGYFSDPLLSG